MQAQNNVPVEWGDASFNKPDSFGKEIAVYIKRND
jgi:hypothetical protein